MTIKETTGVLNRVGFRLEYETAQTASKSLTWISENKADESWLAEVAVYDNVLFIRNDTLTDLEFTEGSIIEAESPFQVLCFELVKNFPDDLFKGTCQYADEKAKIRIGVSYDGSDLHFNSKISTCEKISVHKTGYYRTADGHFEKSLLESHRNKERTRHG